MKLYDWNGELLSLRMICCKENVVYSTAARMLRDTGNVNDAILAAKAARVRGSGGAYIWHGLRYHSIAEIARAAGVSRSTLYGKIISGMDIEEAVEAARNAVITNAHESWRYSMAARKKEQELAARASNIEKIFFQIMGTHNTENFSFSKIGDNQYAWQGDLMDHQLDVGRHTSLYTSRLRSNGQILCRREIHNG